MIVTASITYHFRFGDGRTETVALEFQPDMRVAGLAEPGADEAWTALDFHRCGHCPLPAKGTCPFAAALAPFIHRFDEFFSYEPVAVRVVTEHRTVSAERALQHALASLIGLVGAASGCPHLAFFRPMARFHLPFASEEETLVRSFSLHLLGRVLTADSSPGFEGLQAHYRAAAEVNRGMADRIRAAFAKDAVVNALVVLDTFAQAIPYVIEDRLAEFRHIFETA